MTRSCFLFAPKMEIVCCYTAALINNQCASMNVICLFIKAVRLGGVLAGGGVL